MSGLHMVLGERVANVNIVLLGRLGIMCMQAYIYRRAQSL